LQISDCRFEIAKSIVQSQIGNLKSFAARGLLCHLPKVSRLPRLSSFRKGHERPLLAFRLNRAAVIVINSVYEK